VTAKSDKTKLYLPKQPVIDNNNTTEFGVE
jgi:hypothetical protein